MYSMSFHNNNTILSSFFSLTYLAETLSLTYLAETPKRQILTHTARCIQ